MSTKLTKKNTNVSFVKNLLVMVPYYEDTSVKFMPRRNPSNVTFAHTRQPPKLI
jgi:hypothetical protein